ncbi:NitT/TauT family transport system permease protein [Pseudonocardia thermophila]|jgi:ABC-type nitrate/sulfonate/bicarbonate transport system, permease component|uniref:NitT/TauT family transport system permease protein n=1 Tax=Pseudonocardia thermophila TaxID=1848 RepID=A0A1M6PMM6_PSETH|nr:ABC transporter permease [Pseudonocardia thermophila]SHK09167.1 NitT/TauT family transport system permease protein [Pseudonocardia thermophila]
MTTERPPERTRPKRKRTGMRKWLDPLIVVALLLGLWEFASVRFGIPEYVAPRPSVIAECLAEESGVLLRNLVPTAQASLLGFAIGNGSAILLAIGFVHSKRLERSVYPLAVMSKTIPTVAISPLLVMIFGSGLTPKVLIAALICFFPTLVNMLKGFESVTANEVELFRIMSASRREVFLKLRLYKSLPYLFAALRIATTNAVIGAIVAEWIGSADGIGALIVQASFNFDAPLLYASMLVAGGYALLFFGAVGVVERIVLRWKPMGAVAVAA